MISEYPVFFSVAWVVFSLLWAGKSVLSRWKRKYSKFRLQADKNNRFKFISYFVFFAQLTFIPILFFFDSTFFFKFHNSDLFRLIGLLLCFAGLGVYLFALKHLGRNYSPCFDSHIPFEIITSGPYKLVRHPTWLSKVLVSLGGVLIAGTYWFVPIILWIVIEMRRTIPAEEAYLMSHFSEYKNYRDQTWLVVPYLL